MRLPIYQIISGILLAGIIHITIILLIPTLASQDAWSKLVAIGPQWHFTRLNNADENGSGVLAGTDPMFQTSACRFSLAESPVFIETTGNLPFWSVAVFDRYGKNVYSFNDRTAIDQQLNLLILNSVQMSILREDPPASVEQSIVVETQINEGFVLVRALQPDNSWAPAIDAFLDNASCKKFKF